MRRKGGTINDRTDRSPPHYGALERKTAKVIELINSGADVNAAGVGGYTPLHFASQNDHAAVVKLLLEHHDEVESVDSWGNTP